MTKKPANDSSLLQTRIVDLIQNKDFQRTEARKALGADATAAAVEQETARRMQVAKELNEKLLQPLGTSTQPFPMYGSEHVEVNGRSTEQQVLSVIASDVNPLMVYSDRPHEEVVALAFCDMPVPSMLPLFQQALERRKPPGTGDTKEWNRTQFMIGDPGFGKSFSGVHQGRMRTSGPVEVFDCGGKNMNELLFEMVLDFGAGDALPTAIDKRLKAGKLEPLSLAELKTLPSAAVSLSDDGEIESIDWNYFRGAGAANGEVEAAFDILKKVSEIEGLDKAGGNALGMNSQFGPLIRAFIEGREIVLDEYNKSKEGTDNGLQTMLQFLNGEKEEVTVENPLKNKDTTSGPASFTFRRSDEKIGFFVTFTGNKTEDGITTRSLNKSVYSRLSPITLPDPTQADWQHRICQMMAGVPVSTLYAAYKDAADANPQAFGEWLLELRRVKARIEGTNVPELEETLLLNWENVVNASEKLSKFYAGWAEMTNSSKIFEGGHPELIEEIDEEYSKKEGIDFRKIKQHLEEAIAIRPHMIKSSESPTVDFAGFFEKPELKEQEPENPALAFGTRLVEYLENKVYEVSGAQGKEKLYGALKTLMDESGFRDIVLANGGARSSQKSVEEDLNFSSFASRDLDKQADLAREVFCNYLREADKEIVEQDNDQIITLDRFKKALKVASEENAAESHTLFIVNRDLETLQTAPLATARIEDAATYTANDDNPNEPVDPGFTLADVVGHDDFMASLAIPVASSKNLSAIWDNNIRPLTDAGSDDEALDICENKSSQGIATTTLRVASSDENGEPKDISIHIIFNSARNKALVVGEKLPSKLAAAFKEAGIVHVDRNDARAVSKIETALEDLMRGMPAPVKDRVADAFRYRNALDYGSLFLEKGVVTAEQLEKALTESEQTGDDLEDVLVRQKAVTDQQVEEAKEEYVSKSISQLLVDDKVEVVYGKYVVKNQKLAI